MGYKDDIRCTFCHEEAENFTHLFWFCRKIEPFWKHLFASLKDRNCLSDDYSLNNHVVLGLKPDTSKNKAVINFVLLLARFYIWGLAGAKEIFQLLKILSPFYNNTRKKLNLFLFSNFYQFRVSLSLSLLLFPSYQTFLSDFPGSIYKIFKANFFNESVG